MQDNFGVMQQLEKMYAGDSELPNVKILAINTFFYPLETFDLAAGASTSKNIQIEADSDFWIFKTTMGVDNVVDSVGPTTTQGFDLTSPANLPVLVSLTDTGSGRDMNRLPVKLGSIAGTAELPFIWPMPRRVRATSMITATFENTSATADINGLQVVFAGVKVFYKSAAYGSQGGY